MDDSGLKETLRQSAENWGADLFGVADLRPVAGEIAAEYGTAWQGLDRAISVAVFFPREVVNELNEGPTHTYLRYYDALNARLDDIAFRLANLLQKKGHRSFPIPASQRVSDSRLAAIFSHRLAAHLAGHGWIGKNCALINPLVGPRLRLVTVLTDAPLPGDQAMAGRCGECRQCQEACPPQAIQGVNFQMGQGLTERLDAPACDQYLTRVRHSFGKRICGRCLAACPWGKRGGQREQ